MKTETPAPTGPLTLVWDADQPRPWFVGEIKQCSQIWHSLFIVRNTPCGLTRQQRALMNAMCDQFLELMPAAKSFAWRVQAGMSAMERCLCADMKAACNRSIAAS